MAVEKYIAAAGLGLNVLFVGNIISMYIFMISPPVPDDPFSLILEFDPDPKILQFISIGVAPALIMSGVAFIMSKRYGSKTIGALIIAGGIVLFSGMAYASTLLADIEPTLLTDAVVIVPPLFMGVSAPVIVVGALLFRIRSPKKKKDYV